VDPASAAAASARTGELDRARSFIAEAERIAGMWNGGLWIGAVREARGILREAEGELSRRARCFAKQRRRSRARAINPMLRAAFRLLPGSATTAPGLRPGTARKVSLRMIAKRCAAPRAGATASPRAGGLRAREHLRSRTGE
jgi:hypothetical protein